MSTRVPLDEHMLVSAVRYALGRRTYIVGVTVDEVFRAWPKLTDRTRAIIRRDVMNAPNYGQSIDRERWMWLLAATASEATT